MPISGSPLDLSTSSRNASASPSAQNKSSNLTSALHGAGGAHQMQGASSHSMEVDDDDILDPGVLPTARQNSFSAGGNPGSVSQWSGSSRPILVQNPNQQRPRRESMAGSMVGGMSWGGVSVGSWIRDEIITTGTSPFNPNLGSSHHSSSYLPKMEASFMKDFTCCGMRLKDFHHLLEHWEKEHDPEPLGRRGLASAGQTPRRGTPNSRAAIAANTAASIQQRSQNDQNNGTVNNPQSMQNSGPFQLGSAQGQQMQSNSAFRRPTLPPVQDFDGAEDMDMDDVGVSNEDISAPALLASTNYPLGDGTQPHQQSSQMSHQQQQPQQRNQLPSSSQQQYNQHSQQPHQQQQMRQTQSKSQQSQDSNQSPTAPQLNLATSNLQNQFQQVMRNSQPSTPSGTGPFNSPYLNNPTVSSVNTPTLNTPIQQHQQIPQGFGFSNTSSPQTPKEEESDMFGNLPLDVSMQMNGQYFPGTDNLGMAAVTSNGMLDLCIDEPAKRLFSPSGMFAGQDQQQQQMGGAGGEHDREFAQRIREQRISMGMPGEEHKPFKCPVIGCEKAYKNQNGLKYHKSHGHQNQSLHQNEDGTFSIVDPETHIPYPGTLGMEKEKPYRCDCCGKRYKNLNGLKYHRAHSAPCNPDLNVGPKIPAGITMPMGGAPPMGSDMVS